MQLVDEVKMQKRTDSDEEEPAGIVCCKMNLNPRVTQINVIALFLGCFVVVVQGAILITFT